ncbi:MAG: hypothetical protein HUU26_01125 [Gemmatimonadaceae bacterium]|nr:hypothetical protein [Gemmatimonadaceae bacterium]
MPNICGKAYGFTAFTPIKRWKTPFVRLFFWSVPIMSSRFVQKYFSWIHLVKAQQLLLELSFIHFARWSIVKHDFWPRLSPQQPKDRTRYDYLMFCSNFNGTWEQYIDAFSQVIPDGMNMIWRTSEQFPGAQPITPFLAYIRRVQCDCDYYYGAYPGATATDVRQSLKLYEQLQTFSARTESMDAASFGREWRTFVFTVQDCLGSTGPDPAMIDWQEMIFPEGRRPEDMGPRGLNTPRSVSPVRTSPAVGGGPMPDLTGA